MARGAGYFGYQNFIAAGDLLAGGKYPFWALLQCPSQTYIVKNT